MTKNHTPATALHLCNDELARENRHFTGTGGISKENRSLGFIPAFCDMETGTVYPSCNKDGTPATIHVLEGLPAELVTAIDQHTKCVTLKASVIPGFIKDQEFYTREQAAELVQQ